MVVGKRQGARYISAEAAAALVKSGDWVDYGLGMGQPDLFVVSINNTTEIDLQGQAACESAGHRHLTGTGGQLPFVRGADASPGGKSFMCLSSTSARGDTRRSRITCTRTPGNVITTPRTDVMYVVTEHGLVNLKGKSVAERARALISIAHPDFREAREHEAREKHLIPKGFC